MLESRVPEYDRTGVVRKPSGTTITGIVPSNTYLCQDGKYVIIGGSGDSICKRLLGAAGRPELAGDPRFATNAGRVRHQQELDAAIAAWTATLSSGEVIARLEEAAVPAGPELGAHNREILGGRLGFTDAELEELAAAEVI